MSAELVSLFSFDIPYDINPTCTLNFQLPSAGGLFRDTVVGSGTIEVISIKGVFGTPLVMGLFLRCLELLMEHCLRL